MDVREVSVKADVGALSAAVAVSGVSAQSAAFSFAAGGGDAVVTPTCDVFFRQGANPTALSDGTDMILLGGQSYRVSGILSANKLAFKTSGATGTVYITPNG